MLINLERNSIAWRESCNYNFEYLLNQIGSAGGGIQVYPSTPSTNVGDVIYVDNIGFMRWTTSINPNKYIRIVLATKDDIVPTLAAGTTTAHRFGSTVDGETGALTASYVSKLSFIMCRTGTLRFNLGITFKNGGIGNRTLSARWYRDSEPFGTERTLTTNMGTISGSWSEDFDITGHNFDLRVRSTTGALYDLEYKIDYVHLSYDNAIHRQPFLVCIRNDNHPWLR